ncbi:S1 RNA-binding domain-containing protein [Streptomyces sp. NPDC050264]|uniref:S1 RNA-binding domain-containing protein n=1 Tax=Streptomyces sp. NPDC050264 TaxID=3155038 RepID=UPI0034213B2A
MGAGRWITGVVITSETRRGQVSISLKTVTKIVPFGVFVRLAPCVEGLLHVSEMTGSPVESPDQLVSESDRITVRDAEVDLQCHRVRLHAHGFLRSTDQLVR